MGVVGMHQSGGFRSSSFPVVVSLRDFILLPTMVGEEREDDDKRLGTHTDSLRL